jgi:hypothetical protein
MFGPLLRSVADVIRSSRFAAGLLRATIARRHRPAGWLTTRWDSSDDRDMGAIRGRNLAEPDEVRAYSLRSDGGGVRFEDRGSHAVKGLGRPIDVHRVLG